MQILNNTPTHYFRVVGIWWYKQAKAINNYKMLEKVKRVAEALNEGFGTVITSSDTHVKTTVKTIGNSGISALNELIVHENCTIDLKRSGTSITIIVGC